MLKFPDFSKARILVVGDVMLDKYWHGDTCRISPEAPVPVVGIEQEETRIGGAGNVAVNLKKLGCQVTLCATVGEDEAGQQLETLLNQQGVRACLFKKSHFNTILKLRVVGRHQQLIRLDFEKKGSFSGVELLEKIKPALEKIDILILSDYAKGMLAEPQALIDYARSLNIKILVDPKSRDLSLYRGAHLLTPNLNEFEMMVGSCETPAIIEKKGQWLREKLDLEALLITRGSQGMTLVEKDKIVHIPAQAKEVFDVTGAGDTVIAVLGASLATDTSLEEAAVLANLAAGIVVEKLGTAAITPLELKEALWRVSGILENEILSVDALLLQVAKHKACHQKIVMTNGCFDILHVGHVSYLKAARALGDCLIVAVNDDASVKRLKGKSRPIHDLAARMEVLAALGCVDYVVAFGEDTPQVLIEKVLPDVLVKGGDYQPHQIAGADAVWQNGGEVKILPLVQGYSSTRVIESASRDKEYVGEKA